MRCIDVLGAFGVPLALAACSTPNGASDGGVQLGDTGAGSDDGTDVFPSRSAASRRRGSGQRG
jgi:hypothetical protein